MSRQSKAKRDARRKQQGARPIRRLGRPVQPVATLRDDNGAVIAGGGLRHHEWLMLIGGQVAATTESPAMLLAMLRHTQAMVRETRPLTLEASPELLRAAASEAEAQGQTLEAYLALLDQERAERDLVAEPAPGAGRTDTPSAPTSIINTGDG